MKLRIMVQNGKGGRERALVAIGAKSIKWHRSRSPNKDAEHAVLDNRKGRGRAGTALSTDISCSYVHASSLASGSAQKVGDPGANLRVSSACVAGTAPAPLARRWCTARDFSCRVSSSCPCASFLSVRRSCGLCRLPRKSARGNTKFSADGLTGRVKSEKLTGQREVAATRGADRAASGARPRIRKITARVDSGGKEGGAEGWLERTTAGQDDRGGRRSRDR